MRITDPSNPLAWLLGSFLVMILAANLAWLIVRRKATDPSFQMGPLAALGWLVRALFYLLIPFLALREGIISPYAAGLSEINWPATLSTGLTLAGVLIVALLFGWLMYRRSLPEGQPAQPLARLILGLRGPTSAALQQWHWTFYRAAAAAALLTTASVEGPRMVERIMEKLQSDPLYWGAWLGIALAGVEWALNPFSRAAWRADNKRAAAIRRASLAIATTGLFVLTRNFWLCLAAHLLVETFVATWFALPQAIPQGD